MGTRRMTEWMGAALVSLLLMLWPVAGHAQVSLTQVQDTVYAADGTVAQGTVLVKWPAFTTADGQSVPAGSTSAALSSAGVLTVSLAPNAGAVPAGTYYTVVYHLTDGTTSREFWVVPVSSTAVTIGGVRSTVLPATAARQVATKQYVDDAIAAALEDAGTGTGTNPLYLLKSGGTMTGPLLLPGNPSAGNQAVTKSYVDATTAGVQAGLQQKVTTTPVGTQTVVQPVGTSLGVNNLNGRVYAGQYASIYGNDGVASANNSANCTNGCQIEVENTYAGTDGAYAGHDRTQVTDLRGGMETEIHFNPHNMSEAGQDAGHNLTVVSTERAEDVRRKYGAEFPTSYGLRIRHSGLDGGNNLYPQNFTVPFFKSTYNALFIDGSYNTQGQHVGEGQTQTCYGVGDCLLGARFLISSGGFRDNADEGTHPYDFAVREDTRVFTGTCAAGCTAGSTQVTITPVSNNGTQGDGRFLINTNPAKVMRTGQLTGVLRDNYPYAEVGFTGTNFAVSTFFTVPAAFGPQTNTMAPGTVTAGIAAAAAFPGFAVTTAGLNGQSGVACVADQQPSGTTYPHNYEMAAYAVVDETHLQLTLNKPHAPNFVVSIGGLCGYGLEQTVDTQSGIRQVFPVMGAVSPTVLLYASGASPLAGQVFSTSGFANFSEPVTQIARSGGVVTATLAANFPADLTGLALTVNGVADPSYNGVYAVTLTSPTTMTYAQAGPDGQSSGGTMSLLTGGFALYPMAEVLHVTNPANNAVDGTMTLAPNTVSWAANDAVEEPHYYEQSLQADTMFVSQVIPRPVLIESAGIDYQGSVGVGMRGWSIRNQAPLSTYYGYGGTHLPPDAAYQADGPWRTIFKTPAGEDGVFSIGCKTSGCNGWRSPYSLFQLQSGLGPGAYDVMSYNPDGSDLGLNLRGVQYHFSPSGFTAGRATIGAAVPASDASLVVGSTTAHTLELQGTNPANKRAAFTFSSLYGGTAAPVFEFGTDLGVNGTGDFYIYSYATGLPVMVFSPNGNVSIAGKVSAPNVVQTDGTRGQGCTPNGYVVATINGAQVKLATCQ